MYGNVEEKAIEAVVTGANEGILDFIFDIVSTKEFKSALIVPVFAYVWHLNFSNPGGATHWRDFFLGEAKKPFLTDADVKKA